MCLYTEPDKELPIGFILKINLLQVTMLTPFEVNQTSKWRHSAVYRSLNETLNGVELAAAQFWTCGRSDAYNSVLRWTKSPATSDCSHPVFSRIVKRHTLLSFLMPFQPLFKFSSLAVFFFFFYRWFWSLLRNITLNSISEQLVVGVKLLRICFFYENKRNLYSYPELYTSITNIMTALLKNVFHSRTDFLNS